MNTLSKKYSGIYECSRNLIDKPIEIFKVPVRGYQINFKLNGDINHRENNLPNLIMVDVDTKSTHFRWKKYNKLHRTDGPSEVGVTDGVVIYENYWLGGGWHDKEKYWVEGGTNVYTKK